MIKTLRVLGSGLALMVAATIAPSATAQAADSFIEGIATDARGCKQSVGDFALTLDQKVVACNAAIAKVSDTLKTAGITPVEKSYGANVLAMTQMQLAMEVYLSFDTAPTKRVCDSTKAAADTAATVSDEGAPPQYVSIYVAMRAAIATAVEKCAQQRPEPRFPEKVAASLVMCGNAIKDTARPNDRKIGACDQAIRTLRLIGNPFPTDVTPTDRSMHALYLAMNEMQVATLFKQMRLPSSETCNRLNAVSQAMAKVDDKAIDARTQEQADRFRATLATALGTCT